MLAIYTISFVVAATYDLFIYYYKPKFLLREELLSEINNIINIIDRFLLISK